MAPRWQRGADRCRWEAGEPDLEAVDQNLYLWEVLRDSQLSFGPNSAIWARNPHPRISPAGFAAPVAPRLAAQTPVRESSLARARPAHGRLPNQDWPSARDSRSSGAAGWRRPGSARRSPNGRGWRRHSNRNLLGSARVRRRLVRPNALAQPTDQG